MALAGILTDRHRMSLSARHGVDKIALPSLRPVAQRFDRGAEPRFLFDFSNARLALGRKVESRRTIRGSLRGRRHPPLRACAHDVRRPYLRVIALVSILGRISVKEERFNG